MITGKHDTMIALSLGVVGLAYVLGAKARAKSSPVASIRNRPVPSFPPDIAERLHTGERLLSDERLDSLKIKAEFSRGGWFRKLLHWALPTELSTYLGAHPLSASEQTVLVQTAYQAMAPADRDRYISHTDLTSNQRFLLLATINPTERTPIEREWLHGWGSMRSPTRLPYSQVIRPNPATPTAVLSGLGSDLLQQWKSGDGLWGGLTNVFKYLKP